jgi:hypothetical protein
MWSNIEVGSTFSEAVTRAAATFTPIAAILASLTHTLVNPSSRCVDAESRQRLDQRVPGGARTR